MVIHPDSRGKHVWDSLVLALATLAAIEIPLQLVFEGLGALSWFGAFDWVVTVVFTVDIALNFSTGYLEGGLLIASRRHVTRRYLRSWFIIDLLAAFPFHAVVSAAAFPGAPFLRLFRLLRLLRLARMNEVIHKFEITGVFNPSMMRLFLFAYWIGLMAHWAACMWITLGGPTHLGGTLGTQPEMRYLSALYWVVTTLTTVGYGDLTPKTPAQTVFTMLIMSLGVGVYGYVIGNVASIIGNIDVSRAQFMKKLEGVNAFLRSRDVPTSLQQRIRDYYHYLWAARRGYEEATALDDLPPSLRLEVSLFLHQEIIQAVPMFRGATPAFTRELVSALRPVVFTPGDLIVRRGDYGSVMYFISHGSVDVLAQDEDDVVATLRDGSFFGEMALIYREPRSASIRAAEYCHLYMLDKEQLDRILERFPDQSEQISKEADRRRRSTLSGVPVPKPDEEAES